MSSDNPKTAKAQSNLDEFADSPRIRISVVEIAQRLNIGRQAVYSMLERGIIPGVRVGRRWIVTRHAYMQWERSCGMTRAGLHTPPEVTLLH
jgi:excisionase family DNA binding protein